MSLSFHINFNGQCEEAFSFYAEHLGGKIGTMLRVNDSPVAALSEAHGETIVHANICIDGVDLAGADVDASVYEKPKGFYVLLGVDSEVNVHTYFEALQREGHVVLAPQRTFWSPCYAIVTDRFSVPWKINYGA
ncbi:PhnB protein [Duganella sp. CF402]|uniref:VOC family protein n=1 Tax=unclassified Duganella TaxID=2636909 RepID=UPI0008D52160|nr:MULTISPECIES: VOC family protein [unclassified Duganella]RZT08820.1 PhnB protein [Duganella sp. BK701]SEL80677.1 PhnB protein [Duganella sp. CF402]